MSAASWFCRKSICVFAFFLAQSVLATDLYRVIYSDDPIRAHVKNGRDFGIERDAQVEAAYGSRYVVVNADKKPKEPILVPGVLVNTAEDDDAWVKAELPQNNVGYNFDKKMSDLGGKFSEYQFVIRHTPKQGRNLAPPKMIEGNTILKKSLLSDEELATWRQIDDLNTREARAFRSLITKKVEAVSPEKLEDIKNSIMKYMGGDSILKPNFRNHSEGNVPKAKASKNWAASWEGYIKTTRPKIEQKLRELENKKSSESLQTFIFDWDFIEAKVLEELLLDPQSVVIQKMIDISKEVRVHIVRGKILEGATFLRMYPLGQYLTKAEINNIEKNVNSLFLNNLPKDILFTSSSDIAIEKGTGKMYLLDLNPGYYSGYFFPEEDLFTTHRLAKSFTKTDSAFLRRFEDFKNTPMGDPSEEKLRLLKKIRKDYDKFIFGKDKFAYEHESFWDRVTRHYIDDVLSKNPTADELDLILSHYEAVPLKVTSIYYQLLNEVQEKTDVRLPQIRLAYWKKKFLEWNDSVAVTIENDKLVVKEKVEKAKVKKPEKNKKKAA